MTYEQMMFKASMLEHLPAAIFVLLLGFCVGSFLNVVIYRMPRRIRLLAPPSYCPSCNHQLRFFRENLPIIGWLAVRGKCRYCKMAISAEYPFIELLTGLLFLTLYVLCYWVPDSTPIFGDVFGRWWYVNGIYRTLPMFLALTTLVSGLLAMTVIDARTYTIPIQIPVFMTVTGVIAAGVQGLMTTRHTPSQIWPYPIIDWTWTLAALGGMAGVFFSYVLLRVGIFKYSFADYDEYVKDGEPLAEYPHGRREVLKELLYLVPVMIGFIVGWMIGYEKGFPPALLQGVGGSVLGYIIGGGMVWGIRIFGTLGFGREAMGLGDVHLLAAIGAILGWQDPILIFFIAPFSGLLYAAFSAILAKIGKKHSEIPYGPHLAIATLIVLFCRPGVDWALTKIMPTRPAQQNFQLQTPHDDLTDGAFVDSIRVITKCRWMRRCEQDVSLAHGGWSSDMEKGHT